MPVARAQRTDAGDDEAVPEAWIFWHRSTAERVVTMRLLHDPLFWPLFRPSFARSKHALGLFCTLGSMTQRRKPPDGDAQAAAVFWQPVLAESVPATIATAILAILPPRLRSMCCGGSLRTVSAGFGVASGYHGKPPTPTISRMAF